ncbi:hypothetical protein PG997_003522 [Apiospora hydei]|uniref:Uncharacterized protein n=1 Tax=Apiospora hydei TaxID=1337664 RepID=A0ABR1WZK1_9PEZI
MKLPFILFICFAILGQCLLEWVTDVVRHFPLFLSQPFPPENNENIPHDQGLWLHLPQETGRMWYKPSNFVQDAKHYTEYSDYDVDTYYNEDLEPKASDDAKPKDFYNWIVKFLGCVKKMGKFLAEVHRKAKEFWESIKAKVRRFGASQMRRAFRSLFPWQQEWLSEFLRDLLKVTEDTANLLERLGTRLTAKIEPYCIFGGFCKIPGQLLQTVAQWLRQKNKDFQDDTAQALVDATFSAAWLLYMTGLMFAPQVVWGPALSRLGWGLEECAKVSSVAASLQSKLKVVDAGSWFAMSQSAAQNGYGRVVFDYIVRVPAAAEWAVDEVDWEILAKWFEDTVDE